MHPAVLKAQNVAGKAKENGWHGNIDSELVLATRRTFLNAKRNDERISMIWQDNNMIGAVYSIFGREIELSCAAEVLKRIESWPDVIELIKMWPSMEMRKCILRYRILPWDEKTELSTILGKLKGRHIWWYSELSGKIRDEWVMDPKRKSQVYNIRMVSGRALFNFCTADTGMRSVMLDSILKVA